MHVIKHVDRPVPVPVVKTQFVEKHVPQPYPVEVVKHVDRPVAVPQVSLLN